MSEAGDGGGCWLNPSSVVLSASTAIVFLMLLNPALVRRAAFRAGYLVYTKTPVGATLHRRRLAGGPRRPHVTPERHTFATLGDIAVLPFLEDNYCYVVVPEGRRTAVAVDPADPEVLLAFLREHNLELAAVLCTHHHADHSGGNQALARLLPNLPIITGDAERVPGSTQTVAHGETFHVGGLALEAILTPGHTLGHTMFRLHSGAAGGPSHLFSGDALFVAGCGRLFEGTADNMLTTMERVRALPPSTLVWPGHEYGLSNLVFAASVDPDNAALAAKLDEAYEKKAARRALVPSTLQGERQYNPFLRYDHPPLAALADGSAATLLHLRTLKDNFKAKL